MNCVARVRYSDIARWHIGCDRHVGWLSGDVVPEYYRTVQTAYMRIQYWITDCYNMIIVVQQECMQQLIVWWIVGVPEFICLVYGNGIVET